MKMSSKSQQNVSFFCADVSGSGPGASAALKASLKKLLSKVKEASSRLDKAGRMS